MTEAVSRPKKRKFARYFLLVSLATILLLAAAAWYVTTDSFQSMVRHRLVAELERVSGGRVELASLHTVPFRLQVEMRGLTIHGRETANDTPYIHVDSLIAEIKVISLLETRFGFATLILEQPKLHIIVYPDGATNQPEPHPSGEKKIRSKNCSLFPSTICKYAAAYFSGLTREYPWISQPVMSTST